MLHCCTDCSGTHGTSLCRMQACRSGCHSIYQHSALRGRPLTALLSLSPTCSNHRICVSTLENTLCHSACYRVSGPELVVPLTTFTSLASQCIQRCAQSGGAVKHGQCYANVHVHSASYLTTFHKLQLNTAFCIRTAGLSLEQIDGQAWWCRSHLNRSGLNPSSSFVVLCLNMEVLLL